jgi:hypothetical protein
MGSPSEPQTSFQKEIFKGFPIKIGRLLLFSFLKLHKNRCKYLRKNSVNYIFPPIFTTSFFVPFASYSQRPAFRVGYIRENEDFFQKYLVGLIPIRNI